jgi:hypothetical protein
LLKARAAGIGAGVIVLAGVGLAFAAPPDAYTPPCTANTDSCRQQRIVALENHYKTHSHPTPTPTSTATTASPTPTPTPTPTSTATTASPTPTATSTPSAFPNASNTGVPSGVTLTNYTGATRFTGTAVIDAKNITTGLEVAAGGNLTITNSKTKTIIVYYGGRLTINDSEVDGGTFNGSAIGVQGVTMRRTEVTGARQSVSCTGECDIQDSWLHAQYMLPGSDWHGDGFISNGGANMVVRHNTLACDSPATGSGACSAAMAAFGDWDPIENLVVDNNLFKSSPAGYCLYGGYDPAKPYGTQTRDVKITNNVFEKGSSGKCAVFGPVSAIAPATNGNTFTGNVWDDGSPVPRP